VTIVLMGVAGSGKTTVGTALAERLGMGFFDADGVHSPEAREQMARGVPLRDAQRDAWIERVAAELRDAAPRVVACSALRRSDRDRLRAIHPTKWFLLDVPVAVVEQRLAHRRGHFFAPALLDSQLDRFEPPGSDEDVITIESDRPVAEVVDDIAARVTR
jgi:gluconokinase